MATIMKSGLTGGAASNNINTVIWDTGRRLVRSTVTKTTSFAARSVLSRTTLNEIAAFTSPYTIKAT